MTVVDATTGEILTDADVIQEMTEDEARAHVERINHSIAISADLVIEAWERRAWKALGYSSWDDFTAAEIGPTGLATAQRAVLAVGLRRAGMSFRAIAATTGTSVATAHADAAGVQELNTSTGTDGREYPAKVTSRESTSTTVEYPAENAGDQDGTAIANPAPAPTDSGEADDREAPVGHVADSTSPESPAPGPEEQRLRELAALSKAIHKAHDLFAMWSPERVHELNDPDTVESVRLLMGVIAPWWEQFKATEPARLTVHQGGKQ